MAEEESGTLSAGKGTAELLLENQATPNETCSVDRLTEGLMRTT
jgi:hypothetical protein